MTKKLVVKNKKIAIMSKTKFVKKIDKPSKPKIVL